MTDAILFCGCLFAFLAMLSVQPRWQRPKPKTKPDIPRWTVAELIEQRRQDEADAVAHNVQRRFNEKRKRREATAIGRWVHSFVGQPGERE
jgi:hypothetical protein